MKTKILISVLIGISLVSTASAQDISLEYEVSSNNFQYTNLQNGIIGYANGDTNELRYLSNGSLITDSSGFQFSRGVATTLDGGMLWHYDVQNLRNSSDLQFDSGDNIIFTNSDSRSLRSFSYNGNQKIISVDYTDNLVRTYNGNRELVSSFTTGQSPNYAGVSPTTNSVGIISNDPDGFYIYDENGNQIGSKQSGQYELDHTIEAVNGHFYVSRRSGTNTNVAFEVWNASTGNLENTIEFSDPDAEQFYNVATALEVVGDTIYYTIHDSDDVTRLKAYDMETNTITYDSQDDAGITWNGDFGSVQAENKKLVVATQPALRTFNLPNAPPQNTLTLDPASPDYQESVNLTGSATDADGIDTINISAYRDGNLIATAQENSDTISRTDFFDTNTFGTYNVTLTATDNFGASNTTFQTFTIVNQPPSIDQINTTPPGNEWIYGDNPDVRALISDRETSVDSASVVFLKNGTPQTGNISMSEVLGVWRETNIGVIDERDATWTVKVYATDTDGNTGSGNVSYFVEDLRPKLTGLEVKRNYFDYGRGSWSGAIKLLILGLLVVFGVVVSFF